MEQNGYKIKNMTVGIFKANVFALIIMLPFAIIDGLIFHYVNSSKSFDFDLVSWSIMLAVFFAFVVIHELIHGLFWGLFAKSHYKSIEFGIIWNALTPYCTCSEPLKKHQYIIGSVMPTVILGFGVAAVATVSGNIPMFVLSELMIFSGGGDFFIILKMLLYKSGKKECVFYDHPYECGFVIFEKSE